MRRITPAEVKAAYEKTGLDPLRFLTGPVSNCGCPIAALWVAAGEPDHDPMSWAKEQYGFRYTNGFVAGVDDVVYGRWLDKTGYTDGQAVAAAVFGEGE